MKRDTCEQWTYEMTRRVFHVDGVGAVLEIQVEEDKSGDPNLIVEANAEGCLFQLVWQFPKEPRVGLTVDEAEGLLEVLQEAVDHARAIRNQAEAAIYIAEKG